MHLRLLALAAVLFLVPFAPATADSGVVTNQSAHSAEATVERFEAAIKKRGFMVFARLDHAAAAKQMGLTMPYSTVVVYGNPKAGTPNFLKSPELAIDLPLKALIWEDHDGKVFLTYNSGTYLFKTIYARHGRPFKQEVVDTVDGNLAKIAAEVTK
jgi:uncharacterized protein (DUF302 family)